MEGFAPRAREFIPTPLIETERLLLRPLELADAAQAQPLFARWEIVRLLNDVVPWPFPRDGVETFYREKALPAMARGEEWHWTIRTRPHPEGLIGMISLKSEESRHASNRGFWIGLPWQGNGYATEASRAVTAFWFETLGFPTLTVPKATQNIASRKISEHSGMRLIRTEPHGFVCGQLPADIWQITREEWLALPGNANTGKTVD
ncbi:GNAT family N-acetyltransferase [Granulicella sibirica]|uniref:Putative acetyltransferase n=1 Tax=Granulicella sibirica TaxID=2479048 RepID=A0A4Q0SYE9_9BACT|nr:GNAT family N-acetyltransferase [Granulicella sibirica]RXH54529.1 putative acetyltransferase [Granulicella sibirica]